ncbi:MAG: histidine phosphatase family protein [Oscillospiraceae bacterium]|nr:histidine phosphatase family protein [Oscillospiraceae bacterium]
MKSYVIHFIRHGRIDETLKGAYIGTTDVPLSETGKKELMELDEKYKYPGTMAVFTSPLKRCTQTAQILYPQQKPIVIEQLSECNFGEWEGKTADELKNEPDFEKWLSGSNEVKPPRGESNADFTRRVCNMFESIVQGVIKTGTTESVIITHGGVIMTLLAVYGLPQAKPFDWVMDNGFGYSVRITPLLWQRDKVTEVFNRIPGKKDDDEEL